MISVIPLLIYFSILISIHGQLYVMSVVIAIRFAFFLPFSSSILSPRIHIFACLGLWGWGEKSRDEDPDPVGSVDFWPAGSRFSNFFNGFGQDPYFIFNKI